MVRVFWLPFALVCSTFGQSPILDTINKLQAIPVEDMNTDVTPKVALLHQQLKHQLRDFAISVLNRGADIDTELAKAGISIGQDEKGAPYGQIYAVKVQTKPNGLPTWIALTTTLGVQCGEDTSLYLLERGDHGWQTRLAVEANLNKDVSSAYGWPAYSFSQAGLDDRFLVVATNVTPWCTSVWQTQRIQAFIVQSNPKRSTQVMKKETSICIDDEGGKLQLEDQGFRLEYLAGQNLSAGDRRTHVLRYSLKGNSMIRIAPIALQPEDFLDEWRDLDWNEARQWSSSSLQESHAKLKAALPFDHQTAPCSGEPSRWQVQVDYDPPAHSANQDPRRLFAIVTKKDGNYYLESIRTDPAPGCPSGDSQ